MVAESLQADGATQEGLGHLPVGSWWVVSTDVKGLFALWDMRQFNQVIWPALYDYRDTVPSIRVNLSLQDLLADTFSFLLGRFFFQSDSVLAYSYLDQSLYSQSKQITSLIPPQLFS